MNKRLLLVPFLLLAFGLALSACGGGSSSSGGSSDESQIEEAIEISSTSTEPSTCTEFSTQEFLEETTSQEGPAAVKQCEEAAEEGEVAESAEVSQVEIEGSEAAAEVKFTGGALGGQAIAVGLVKEGDSWKLEEIIGFTVLDKSALAETVGTSLEEEGGEVAKLAPCIEEGIEESGQTAIEELLFSGTTAPTEELAAECQE
jgi:hypothetical protein